MGKTRKTFEVLLSYVSVKAVGKSVLVLEFIHMVKQHSNAQCFR